MSHRRHRKRGSASAFPLVMSFLSQLHWAFLLALSVGAFLGVRAYATTQPLASMQGLGLPLAQFWEVMSWAAGGLFLILSVASFFRSATRRRLLDNNTTLAHIQAMDWRAFERLVGEAYRRQGYGVKETGQGGADGGIDLLLTQGGKTTLVQCKQWRSRSIGAPTVREMWGLAHHHGASAVKIVGVGHFTPAAHDFAQGKDLELVSGTDLVALIQSVSARGSDPSQVMPATAAPPPRQPRKPASPGCPLCAAPMKSRVSRKDGARFWGCSHYPSCTGTRPIAAGR